MFPPKHVGGKENTSGVGIELDLAYGIDCVYGSVSTDPDICEYGEKFIEFGLAFPLKRWNTEIFEYAA